MPEDNATPFQFCDEIGPVKGLEVYDPRVGLRGIVVVDNVACGPAIGGVRMATDVTREEVFRLARAMTFKNAAAGLAHGGGKSGIVADPHQPLADKEPLIRAFAQTIRKLEDYIPGPDMGTDETCMAWVKDEIGRSLGLPRVVGGIPLDEVGATAYGLARCAEVAAPVCGLDLKGARVAIEGFGNVGRPAAQFLVDMGAVLVAASDSSGAVYDAAGIDVAELTATKQEHGSVTAYGKGRSIPGPDVLTCPCDILVPAARPDCIHEENAPDIEAKLILEGANIPTTAKADLILHERGVLSVPDFIANAGGVICGAVEYHGGSEQQAFEQITEKIKRNTAEVLSRSRDSNILPRQAAIDLAKERVLEAMALRR